MREPCPDCGLMNCAHQGELTLAPVTPVQNLNEWREIQRFAKECRKLWPGARIVIRPTLSDDQPADVVGITLKDETDEY